MRAFYEENRIVIIAFLYGLITLPVFYGSIFNGLDPSWSYALSKLVGFENLKFGKDFVCTYGPLGFLVEPKFLNYCYIYSGIIYLLLFVGQMIMFLRFMRHDEKDERSIYAAIFILFIGNPCGSADRFIQYCVLLALAVLWKNIKDNFAVAYYLFSVTIASFYKFSVAIGVVVAVLIFIFGKLWLREFKRIWILLLPGIMIPSLYFAYNPSVRDFLRYIKGSWEVAVGYNTAMSISGNDMYVAWMFILMAIYISIIFIQIAYGNLNNAFVMMWLSPCMFMSYKHGYVRADGHTIEGFAEIMVELSVLILLFDISEIKQSFKTEERKGIVQTFLILALFAIIVLNYETEIHPFLSLRNRIHNITAEFDTFSKKKYEKSVDSLEKVPDSFVEEIGSSSFTSFPWEISFIEPTGEFANQFVPLFTLQSYSAYTPYLDYKTAKWLGDISTPEYIIFKFDTIDDRLALFEVPATWKAIQDYYVLSIYDANTGYLLLKRNNTGGRNREGDVQTDTIGKEEEITTNDCDEIRILADLSVKGKVMKSFWKIPAVVATVKYTDGKERKGRVLLDNLRNGIMVKGMPYDVDTLTNSTFSDGAYATIKSISLDGDGLEYYANEISIERIYYDRPKETDITYLNATSEESLKLQELKKGESGKVKFNIEHQTFDPYTSISGWAVIEDNLNYYRCYLKYNGKYYECSKADREDIIRAYALGGGNKVGFSIKLPVKMDEAELIFMTKDKYYEIHV